MQGVRAPQVVTESHLSQVRAEQALPMDTGSLFYF